MAAAAILDNFEWPYLTTAHDLLIWRASRGHLCYSTAFLFIWETVYLGTAGKISMNCVSCVVIFFLSFRINTENASFQHNEHRWSVQMINLLLLLLQLMFEVPFFSTHAGSQTSTPLIHCHTDDVW